MYDLICRICKRPFKHGRSDAELCFDCAISEVTRLKEQEDVVDGKLLASPELCDLLEKLPLQEILTRLRARWYFMQEYNPSVNPNNFQEGKKE